MKEKKIAYWLSRFFQNQEYKRMTDTPQPQSTPFPPGLHRWSYLGRQAQLPTVPWGGALGVPADRMLRHKQQCHAQAGGRGTSWGSPVEWLNSDGYNFHYTVKWPRKLKQENHWSPGYNWDFVVTELYQKGSFCTATETIGRVKNPPANYPSTEAFPGQKEPQQLNSKNQQLRNTLILKWAKDLKRTVLKRRHTNDWQV